VSLYDKVNPPKEKKTEKAPKEKKQKETKPEETKQ
jgi:hypothetical protein